MHEEGETEPVIPSGGGDSQEPNLVEQETSPAEILEMIKSRGPHKKVQIKVIGKLAGVEGEEMSDPAGQLAEKLFLGDSGKEIAGKIEEAIYEVIFEVLGKELSKLPWRQNQEEAITIARERIKGSAEEIAAMAAIKLQNEKFITKAVSAIQGD